MAVGNTEEGWLTFYGLHGRECIKIHFLTKLDDESRTIIKFGNWVTVAVAGQDRRFQTNQVSILKHTPRKIYPVNTILCFLY